jgi:hypothetical protein
LPAKFAEARHVLGMAIDHEVQFERAWSIASAPPLVVDEALGKGAARQPRADTIGRVVELFSGYGGTGTRPATARARSASRIT